MAPANHLETPSPNELLKNGLTEDLKDKYLKIRLIYHDRAQKSLFTRKHVLEVFKQKTILSYSKQPERPVSNWETKLLAAGAIGVAVGLYVASKA